MRLGELNGMFAHGGICVSERILDLFLIQSAESFKGAQGVDAGFGEMLGYLPVIFFGAATPGPMRSVAILLWVLLFPDKPGEMAAFGFVQHNFFILFNGAIGLLFVRRATRELFEGRGEPA